jgi:hypothetical protein
LFEHVPGSSPGTCLFGKPVSTFPDHALGPDDATDVAHWPN